MVPFFRRSKGCTSPAEQPQLTFEVQGKQRYCDSRFTNENDKAGRWHHLLHLTSPYRLFEQIASFSKTENCPHRSRTAVNKSRKKDVRGIAVAADAHVAHLHSARRCAAGCPAAGASPRQGCPAPLWEPPKLQCFPPPTWRPTLLSVTLARGARLLHWKSSGPSGGANPPLDVAREGRSAPEIAWDDSRPG